MTNLCGHDRDALIWACNLPSNTLAEWSTNDALSGSWRGKAARAVVDPAKLADMLAEEACRLEVVVCDSGHGGTDRRVHRLANDNILVEDRELTLVQARTVLSQWLQLLDGAREEAERCLRGEA